MEKSNLEILVDDEYKLSNLINDFESDCLLPNTSKELSTSNLGTGLLLSKWHGKYSRVKIRIGELKIQRDSKENEIKQKCRHDKTFNRNTVIDKTEMNEKVEIDEEYILIKTKISKLEAILEYLSSCVEHFRYRNSQIQNQIELIKFINMAY
jgi:hypothetical protein